MERKVSESDDLYVVVYDNGEGEITFPMGGGSSTRPSIKAHPSYDSALRSSKHFKDSKVAKAIGFKVMESEKGGDK